MSLLRFLSLSQKKPYFSLATDCLNTPNALKVGTTATRLRCGMLVETLSTAVNEDNGKLPFYVFAVFAMDLYSETFQIDYNRPLYMHFIKLSHLHALCACLIAFVVCRL